MPPGLTGEASLAVASSAVASSAVASKCRLRVAGTLFHGPECWPEKSSSPSSRTLMRDLFEERGTDSTEILNQVQDDEPSVGIFRDDKVALASTLIPNATIHYTCSRHSEGACDRGISSMLAETIAVEPPFFTPLPLSSERLTPRAFGHCVPSTSLAPLL